MTTIVPDVLNAHTRSTRCDGTVIVDSLTYTDVSTACHPEDTAVTRTNHHGRYSKGFRPYTDHDASGVRYKRWEPGKTEVFDRQNVCTGGNPTALSHIQTLATCYVSSIPWGGALPSHVVDEDRVAGLLTKAFAEATAPIFDISTNVGELPEVIQMFVSVHRRLKDLLVEVLEAYIKRLVRKHGALWPVYALRDGVNGVESFWLEYRYGWRPLVSSIRDLSRALERIELVDEPVYQVGKASYTVSQYAIPLSVVVKNTIGPGIYDQSQVTTSEISIVERAAVTALLPRHSAAFNSNSLVTAWELIPLSFMIDWVADVGSYLGALARKKLPTQITACTSHEVKHDVSSYGTIYSEPSDDFYRYAQVPFRVDASRFVYSRRVRDTVEPSVALLPHLTRLQAIDLAALLHQRLPSIRK